MIILSKWYMYSLFEMIYDCLFERSDSALNHFEMIYQLLFWNDISKETVFCTPLACSECLPIESWPNSIGKHPAEKGSVNPFEMIYDFHFEMSDSDHNRFEMIYLLSFRNDHAKFSYRGLFSSGKTPCILVTKITPKPHVFVHRFFRSDCPLAAWK